MRTIRVSDRVLEVIAREGRFGETHDDVLQRLLLGTVENPRKTAPRKRDTSRPRTDQLFLQRQLKPGDLLSIRGYAGSDAKVVDSKHVRFKGEVLTYNQWGQRVTGHSTNIYQYAVNQRLGKTFSELRDALRES